MTNRHDFQPDQVEVLKPFLAGADHVDVKQVYGDVSLEQFILGMLSYYPGWLRLLYRVRAVLARGLGLEKYQLAGGLSDLIPHRISFTPGDTVLFFTVREARENSYWISETPEDKHLTAYIAVLKRQQEGAVNGYDVITIVRYKHWTGPIYFNLIRPFHHLVVSRMARAGIRAGQQIES
jgi:hypothetical protein